MRALTICRSSLALGALVFGLSGARADDPVDAGSRRFKAVFERPLFSPTRRPPPSEPRPVLAEPVERALPPPPPPPTVLLSGIILGGGRGVAVLRRPQDQAAIRVALGGQVDGWTLTEIRPRAVVLRLESRSVTVELPNAAR